MADKKVSELSSIAAGDIVTDAEVAVVVDGASRRLNLEDIVDIPAVSAAVIALAGEAGTTAADVVFTPASGIAATDVQAAIVEAKTDATTAVTDHTSDTSAAHAASAISFSPTGTIAATDVQAAVAEVASEAATALSDHTGDSSAAHAASAISFSPTGGIAATDAQAAIAELDTEKAPKASPTFTGTVTLPTGLTGVLRADTGVVSVDSDVTDIVAAASTIAAGKVELATTAETETGTDATRAVTPDGLHDMTTIAGAAWVLDEDDLDSNSDTKLPTQQSVKAYIDDQITAVIDAQANFAVVCTYNGSAWTTLAGGTYPTSTSIVRVCLSLDNDAAPAPTYYNANDRWYAHPDAA